MALWQFLIIVGLLVWILRRLRIPWIDDMYLRRMLTQLNRIEAHSRGVPLERIEEEFSNFVANNTGIRKGAPLLNRFLGDFLLVGLFMLLSTLSCSRMTSQPESAHAVQAAETPATKWFKTEIPLTVYRDEMRDYETASAQGFWHATSTEKEKQLVVLSNAR